MSAERISRKDLERAAADLKALTGEDYSIFYYGTNPSLVLTKDGKQRSVQTDRRRELWHWINAFHDGIGHGLRMASECRHPDLADPKKALQRIDKELERLLDAGGKDWPTKYQCMIENAADAVHDAISYASPIEEIIEIDPKTKVVTLKRE